MKKYDICIIGAGLIGSSIARELAKYNKKIVVLESNLKVGMETTTGNSGLVHGGFDPTPGKLNAKLNVLGKKRYEDWIKEMEFPYLRIDSLIVGFDDLDLQHINMLYQRGLTNGLDPKEMKILNKEQVLKKEPNISQEVKAALLCNSSIAVDPVALTETLMKNAIKNGVELKLNSKVISIKKDKNIYQIKTANNDLIKSTIVINVAGHYADVISKMAGHDEFDLVTKRGEYRILEKTEFGIVNSVVFMVPTIHGKGVIVAPTLDGHVLVGPTSEDFVPKNETRLITKEKYDLIGDIGKKIIPSINMNKTCMSISGSRPIEPKTDDFWIKPSKKDEFFINVAGMKSPGLSSAPAIADLVIHLVKNKMKLEINNKWDPNEKNPLIYKN
ncbi:FAD-dependent oxidoreductase [Mesoplasma chauliocola]|uniref:FAD-dependent oxidoreductase n=1 Tax=Mesoplasma chauliocola TaxID=216427 RepID=A0A249SNY9_9MOLU|nr:type 2 glycerol-3-phosphate oxidase [Mesoplasma chauliocola]ASZ09384.1 FAD-dependent oxidoreductase [Mesoplasma chauliocola]